MTNREARARNVALALFLLFTLFLLLKNANVAASGAAKGLSLCARTLLPSLFPFLVLSELLVASGAGEKLGALLGAPISRITGVSGRGATCFLLGVVCGFPVATLTARGYLSRGEISKKEAERVLLFANNPGAAFLVATVGEGLLGAKGKGGILLFSTLLASLLFGVLLRLVGGKAETVATTKKGGEMAHLSPTVFTECVKRALSAALTLSAFVILFSAVGEALAAALNAVALPSGVGIFLQGVLELTGGLAAATALPTCALLPAMAFFCAFSGLSVAFQIHAVAEGIDVRMGQYLAAKTAQGALAALFAFLLSLI